MECDIFVTACPYNLCCESVSRKCKKASKTFINLCTPCLCKHYSKTNKKRLPMFKFRAVISKTQQLLHCSFPRKHPTNPSVAKSSHLCYTFKGRLKSGTFSHFDGMLFNHQGCTWQRKFRVLQIIHHLLRRSPPAPNMSLLLPLRGRAWEGHGTIFASTHLAPITEIPEDTKDQT